ncbi:MAG: hypothetical protein ABSB79_00600 [Syntrophales bacterium]|jgi:hypothetical protein
MQSVDRLIGYTMHGIQRQKHNMPIQGVTEQRVPLLCVISVGAGLPGK